MVPWQHLSKVSYNKYPISSLLIISVLCTYPRLNLDLRNNDSASALWLGLQQLDSTYLDSEDPTEQAHTFAARLIQRGSSTDAVDTRTGNSLLHRAAMEKNEAAAIFLVHHRAIPNHKNVLGETPIHVAAQNGLHRLVKDLLQNGADPNLQTSLKPTKPQPLSLPGSSKGSLNRLDEVGVASGSNSPLVTRMPSGGIMGADILSPSTLGALNALNFTSQVRFRRLLVRVMA